MQSQPVVVFFWWVTARWSGPQLAAYLSCAEAQVYIARAMRK